jgi:dihydrolipoamide dehydrogenase
MLAHAASHEMEVVIDNILGRPREFDRSVVPAVVFVRPETASVGLGEDRAKELGLAVDVGRFSYSGSGNALCLGEKEGKAKVIADRNDGRLLGGVVVGAHAAELIAELAVAVKAGLSVAEFIEIIHAHPTLSEIVLEAAADSQGLAVHKVSRKKH